MRVAHALPFTGVGGTEHGTLRLARAVEPFGVESFALCLDTAPDVQRFFSEAGIRTLTWHARDPGWGPASYFRRSIELAIALRRKRIRVVHCADSYAVTQQVILAARLAGAAVVCHVRNRNEALSNEQQLVLSRVSRFVFVSRASWKAFAVPVSPEQGSVLYDGVAVNVADGSEAARVAARAQVTKMLGIAPGAPLLSMIARVEPQKDFLTLGRAVKLLAKDFPELCVLVVGGTNSTPEQRAHFPMVQQELQRIGVSDRMRFLGFRSDIPMLLRASDVSVLSTHWEGLPLVLWESMAQGTPVVATDVDGIPEAIQHEVTGMLVPHASETLLADAIARLLRDPDRARKMGRAGMAHAQDTFSSARFGAQVRELYDAALRN